MMEEPSFIARRWASLALRPLLFFSLCWCCFFFPPLLLLWIKGQSCWMARENQIVRRKAERQEKEERERERVCARDCENRGSISGGGVFVFLMSF